MERISLDGVRHAERQRWCSGDEWDDQAPKIAIGELLGGGGWYVRTYAYRAGAWPLVRIPCAYPGPHAEHYARATAGRWMRTLGGSWVEASM